MDKGVVLAVSGWREFKDADRFNDVMNEFVVTYGKPSMVIHGRARGADRLADEWAKHNNIKCVVMKPLYDRTKDSRHNKIAPLLRNTDIINMCTHLVAFPCNLGSGTQDAIRKARLAGKIVTEIQIKK